MLFRRILLFAMLLHSGAAFSISYFESTIDYWQEKLPKQPEAPTSEKTVEQTTDAKPPTELSKTPASPFDWNKHTDPKNDDFFREGDYTPPAPFMELARHPSDENIKQWFRYIEKKNELSRRLQERMQEYVARNGPKMGGEALRVVDQQAKQVSTSQDDHTRYRFRLYFHSECPHCKRMMQSMRELQELGYYVEIVQIDDNKNAAKGLSFPVRQVERGEMENKGIRAWPVLFVGDLKKKVVYRINGYQPTASILNSLRRST